jgi:hypothetical protein
VQCADDRECVDRQGYGSVCVDASCRDYQDRTDLFDVWGAQPMDMNLIRFHETALREGSS